MKQVAAIAPEWIISEWLNSDKDLSLTALRGRVIVAGAFQMLCPGCVSELVPQLRQIHSVFKNSDIAVLGLHTVFEHHAAMQPVSLMAFLHENRLTFPVAVDKPQMPEQPIPATMELYGMQGTPTMMLIDRKGQLRRLSFGHVLDLVIGSEISALLSERD